MKNIFTLLLFTSLAGNFFFARAYGSGLPDSEKLQTIFADTGSRGHVRIHHFFEAGFIFQEGRQYVRTYNNYDRTTNAYNNNLVQQQARNFSFRVGQEVVFKNKISAGITYGFDIAPEPHDITAFVPLLLHVSKKIRLSKKVELLFTQRVGYAFYLHNPAYNPLQHYTGVIGGFAAETVLGLHVITGPKTALQFLPGYRLQHLYSKTIFTPGAALTQVPGYTTLPARITEISNGFYSFVYFTMGLFF